MRYPGILSQPGRCQVAWLLLTLSSTLACIPDDKVPPDDLSSPAEISAADGGAEVDGTSPQDGADAGSAVSEDAGPSEPEEPDPPVVEEDDAEWIEVDLPESMDCGATAEAEIVVRNTGSVPWTRAGGYKLGTVGDEDPFRSTTRVWLSNDDHVPPGESHRFQFELLAPEEPGRYISDWRMVHEAVRWFGPTTEHAIVVECEDAPEPQRPLPNMSHVVRQLAAERPELLAGSCLEHGGGWEFLNTLVQRLRETDERWGFNWKRGVVGQASEDVVDYHYGDDRREGSTQVYIIDVIVGHCGDSPRPGWGDQTAATARAGTIGRWTSRDQF